MSRKLCNADIEHAISTLNETTRDELAVIWTSRNGHPPPKGCGRTLLELAEAHAIQVSNFGGLKPSLRRKLESEPKGIFGRVVEHKTKPRSPANSRKALSSCANGTAERIMSMLCREGSFGMAINISRCRPSQRKLLGLTGLGQGSSGYEQNHIALCDLYLQIN